MPRIVGVLRVRRLVRLRERRVGALGNVRA